MKKQFPASSLGFWRLQSIGWLTLCLIGAVGSIPLQEGSWVYLYWIIFTGLGFTASLLLRLLSNHLLERQSSWTIYFGKVAAASYLLAFLCSAATVFIERALRGKISHSFRWAEFLASAFADSIAQFIILIAWVAIYFGIKQWQASLLKEEQLVVLESMAREAELRALRYQITPHFLFNTLNGISTLVGEGNGDAAREMIALLGEFLRTTLETTNSGDVTLNHEMIHMEQYLAIEQVRLGDRLKLSVSLDGAASQALVPNLLLQPVLENAIRHGIAQNKDGGLLEIIAILQEETVVVSITNSTEDRKAGDLAQARLRNPMGLANTKMRLSARYGSAAALEVHKENSRLWRVVLKFPYEVNHNR